VTKKNVSDVWKYFDFDKKSNKLSRI